MPPPKTNKNKQNNDNNDKNDEYIVEVITKQLVDFETRLTKHSDDIKDELTKSLGGAISNLQDELSIIRDIAEKAMQLAEQNKKSLSNLQSENTKLKQQLVALESERIAAIEESIEDRTNRQLRKTVIFRGIAESDKETWDQTEAKLVSIITDISTYTTEDASEIIERCHRSKPNPRYKGNGPRPIVCQFANWKDSEQVKKDFFKNNITNRSNSIYAEQKYGPITTARRSQALKLRKQLKSSGEIVSGYIAFPAKLMVKKERDDRYVCKRDFSNEEIKFRV